MTNFWAPLRKYFNRRLNCQPSFPASAIVAEPRIFLLFVTIFFRKNSSNFHTESHELWEHSNFLIFFHQFLQFFSPLSSALYASILYFQKLILSQIKVPYVCQFLRKFQLDIINLCSHTNQKCQ